MRISDCSSDVYSSDLSEADFAKQVIAQRIDAEAVGERHRIDDIAERLRHLFPAIEQKAVAEYLLRQRQVRAHQKSRPVNRMKTNDILADHMDVRWPECCEIAVRIGKAETREIGRQRIDPNIHHMPWRPRHRHTPVETGARDA